MKSSLVCQVIFCCRGLAISVNPQWPNTKAGNEPKGALLGLMLRVISFFSCFSPWLLGEHTLYHGYCYVFKCMRASSVPPKHSPGTLGLDRGIVFFPTERNNVHNGSLHEPMMSPILLAFADSLLLLKLKKIGFI